MRCPVNRGAVSLFFYRWGTCFPRATMDTGGDRAQRCRRLRDPIRVSPPLAYPSYSVTQKLP